VGVVLDERNLGAQLFLRARGFRAVGLMPGFYEDHDGIAFTCEVPQPSGMIATASTRRTR